VIVEASLLARLLGMKLLTLEGTVVLSSAEVEAFRPHSAATGVRGMPTKSGGNVVDRDGSTTVGPALVEAGRLIADSAAVLESSRTRFPGDG
jgi:hypothetical protein